MFQRGNSADNSKPLRESSSQRKIKLLMDMAPIVCWLETSVTAVCSLAASPEFYIQ